MLTPDQITAIYEKASENQPSAGLDVTEANKAVSRALDDYCSALQYETFLWAYALGYEHGQHGVSADLIPYEDEEREEEGWV